MSWYNEYKAMEQSWMVLKDQYSEIVRALGFPGVGFWGDPVATKEEILKRIEEMKE